MGEFATRYKNVLANGYPVIPIVKGEKRPLIDEWQTYCDAFPEPEALAQWASGDHGLGIPCGKHVIAVDIDFLNPERAAEAERRVLEIVGCEGTLIRTGQFPKRALVFRPSEKMKSQSARWIEDGQKQGFDILMVGRQFVAFGVHPDSGKEYTWRGGTPETVSVAALPVVTPEIIKEIFDYLAAFMPRDAARSKKQMKVESKKIDRPAPKRAPVNREAAEYIIRNLPNSDAVTWDEWVRVGFALHSVFGDDGFEHFDSWSSKSPVYNAANTQKKWQTIIRDNNGSVTFGTLVAMASENRISVPAEIEFSSGERPEIDLSAYVERLAAVEVGPDGMSCDDYYTYLHHIYSGPDDTEELWQARCPLCAPPEKITADDIERVRMIVIRQLGGIGQESPRDIKVAFRSATTLDDMRRALLQTITDEEIKVSDTVVSYGGLSVRLTPRSLPMPPPAARFKVPGVIGEFAAWADSVAAAHVPEFSVTAGLAIVSTLVGRAVKTSTGIRPNVYIINMVSSGTGKANGGKRLKAAMEQVGALDRHVLGSMVHSGSAIRNAFSRAAGDKNDPTVADGSSMSKLCISDEVSVIFEAATAGKSSMGSTVMSDLLTFFSASDEILPGTVLADRPAPSIPYPHLTIFGTSTPSQIFDRLTLDHLQRGHANRFLMMQPVSRPTATYEEKMEKWQRESQKHLPPESVKATMNALIRWTEKQRGMIATSWDDFAYVVPMDEAASKFMAAVDMLKDACCETAEKIRELPEPFTRIDEMTAKIALLSAMSRLTAVLTKNGNDYSVVGSPEITESDVRFGFELAKYSAERVAYAAANNTASASATAEQRVLATVMGAGVDGISRNEITRKLRLGKRALDEALDTLTQSREIVPLTFGRTKKGIRYLSTSAAKSMISNGHLPDMPEILWN